MEAHPLFQREFYAPARQLLEDLIDDLKRPEALKQEFAPIEEMVVARGREVLRGLLQGFADSRAEDRPIVRVVGAEGVERTQQRQAERDVTTQVGTIQSSRRSFGAPGVGSRRPLDAALNLPPTVYSHSLEARIAEQVAHTSFEQAQQTIRTHTGVVVGVRQMEEVAQRVAVDFDAFYEQRQVRPTSPANRRTVRSRTGSVLVLSGDGKGVVMHTQDLRPETRKKALARKHKLDKRLSPGEKKDRKRMAEVATVYTTEPHVRTAADFVHEAQAVQEVKQVRPKPEGKRVWASLEKDIDEVIGEVFEEASFRDPDRVKNWVALVDGNQTQIAALLREALAHGVELFILIDIIHVLEYLWKAAWPLHPDARPEAEAWVTKHLRALLEGDAHQIAAGIRRSATLRGLDEDKRKAVDACADYLHNHAPYLRYAEALAAGYPIATGVIEGACRHLVQDRMDITGARWRLKTAEAVLRLRALQSSGDWEEYRRFHEKKEHERHHEARYAGGKPPAMASPLKTRLRRIK